MTRREARKSLGSRVSRRAGTKTKVIPGGADHKPTKYRARRASKGKPSLASKVERKWRQFNA